MKWEDAKMCIALDRLDLLRRSPDVLRQYNEYRQNLASNGINIRDVILKKMRKRLVKWMKNDYPYNVEGTKHYLIWSMTPLENYFIRDFADKYTGGREYLTFVNPEHLKSIPDIWHVHVLVRMT
ncbi:protein of unknown function (DUF3605) [Paramecium bursaria Chlorella virus AN69C]|uniref:Uncharacterized protein n=1 Tax=Paramecium bursaria Chlorella virus IL3A TaxID=46019 RepID=M1HPU0_PBCVI|nr:protein of unknown function (DUF3605) [Paramecium bursaria Chlorella virus AN69C]AGE53892.1 protein of unknown function (DUF3605) [Paramecium bursaria Chlorella virus IL3A]AGE57320.1 protein of unknown function (DUF3605) [Paramecium bursaria Chlorella virus NE-JV-4]